MWPEPLLQDDSIESLRTRARRRLPRAVFDFIDGGAELETTLQRNVDDFKRITLVPHCFVDVGSRDLTTNLLGHRADMPLIVGPTGLAALAWPGADLALARAASAAKIPFVVSTSSSARLEDIRAAVPTARLWFQIYPYKDQNLVKSLISRAAKADFEAIVLTVDTPVLGHRSRDYRNRFSVPLHPTWRLLWDTVRCARWTWGIARHGVPRMQNFVDYGHGSDLASLADLMTRNMNAAATWSDLAWIRSCWNGKLILKGVLSADGAASAVAHGLDAIIVSNHGGRQLDGAPSSISILPEIVQRVSGRAEIFIDGGIRRGIDIAKAVAIGARAAMIGRAALYGVAAAGSEGADHALALLRTEFDRSLALLGCPQSSALSTQMVRYDR